MKDNLVISTMPIKPQKKTNIGMLIAPTLVSLFGDIFNCEKIISMNSLNTYHDKDLELNVYKNDINENKISYDRVFVDKENVDKILSIIERLYSDGFITIKTKEKVICECGKVDMLNNFTNYNAKLFDKNRKGEIFCKECGKVCKCYKEENLFLELRKDIDDSVNIVPLYLKKEMNGFSKQFKGTDILISKNRNTGYSLLLNGKVFNIDIDFLWNNFFKLFEQESQVLIASNHQLLLMYLMNYFSKITSKKNLTFVANPYVLNKDEDLSLNFFEKDNEYYKKLFILYNLKWGQKTCYWSQSVINYLNTISDTKLLNLYKSIILYSKDIISSDTLTLDKQIDKILSTGTNMQNNIKLMKKLYKDGYL